MSVTIFDGPDRATHAFDGAFQGRLGMESKDGHV